MAKNKRYFNGKEYQVIGNIGVYEKGAMARNIADAVFSDGIYAPYILNAAFDLNCVVYYTNIELPKCVGEDGEQSIDFTEAIKQIESNGIVDSIRDVVDYEILEDAIALIEFNKAKYLKKSKLDDLIDTLIGIVDKLDVAVEKSFKDIDIKEVIETAKSLATKDEGKMVDEILKLQDFKNAKS